MIERSRVPLPHSPHWRRGCELTTVRERADVRASRWLILLLCAGLGPTAYAQLESGATTIERVKPAIVAVGTYQATRNPAFQFRGTGFAVGDGRSIVTNAHVLRASIDRDKLERLVIARPLVKGGAEIQTARDVVRDEAHDLALLRIGKPLPALTVGDGKAVREGDLLLFTGFPIGGALGLYHATHRAMVAAVTPIAIPMPNDRRLDAATIRRLSATPYPVFQLDATAYPGNSGSPLYHPQTGEVLGIINMVFVKGSKEAVLSHPSGITYAIPATHLRALLSATDERR